MRKALITGSSGFIGFHLCKTLLKTILVLWVDNMSDYYDVKLKNPSCTAKKYSNFEFVIENINASVLSQVFEEESQRLLCICLLKLEYDSIENLDLI